MADGDNDIIEATDRAIASATHLTDADVGAVEALRVLARKIAAWDQIVEWALEDAGNERRPSVPANDNVSVSAYVKTCEQLGLTPAGRVKLTEKKSEGKGGKLGRLSSVPKPA